MLHPIIHYDAKESPYIPLRKDLVRVCDGDGRTAQVLALVEFWTNSFIKRNPDCDDLPWFRETIQDFVEGLFGTMTAKTIGKKLKWLTDTGLLCVRGSGKFQDRAKEYQINLPLLQQKLGRTEGKTTVCDLAKIPNGDEQRVLDTNGKTTNCETVKIPNGDEQDVSPTNGKTTDCTKGKTTESQKVKLPNDPYISNNQNTNNQSRTDFFESQARKEVPVGSKPAIAPQPKTDSSLASKSPSEGNFTAPSRSRYEFEIESDPFNMTEIQFTDPEAVRVMRYPQKCLEFVEWYKTKLNKSDYYQKREPATNAAAQRSFYKKPPEEKYLLVLEWREVKEIEAKERAKLASQPRFQSTLGKTWEEVHGEVKRKAPVPNYDAKKTKLERIADILSAN